MDQYWRTVLDECKDYILQDLKVSEVSDHLQSKHLLTEHDIEQIKLESVERDKAAFLLQILPERGGNWYEEFLSALTPSYLWLVKKLKDTADEGDPIDFCLNAVGNVPSLPKRNVSRTSLLGKIRERIKVLQRRHYLVVKGLSGSGKSCLVAEALWNQDLLFDSLGGHVYWLTVGDVDSSEDKAEELQCQRLQKGLCDMVNLSAKPDQDLRVQLRRFFGKPSFKDGLIILDNVSSSKVIEALDIGAKILITTIDDGPLKHFEDRYEIFPLEKGFTEEETLEVLKNSTGNDLSLTIRRIAQRIHKGCKGMPFVIGLLAGHVAENIEEAAASPERWEAFEKELTGDRGENSRRQSWIDECMPKLTIKLTINSLDHLLRDRYQMFAVFVEETNITVGVLETLWGINIREIEKTMNNLQGRSLVVRKYSKTLKSYVYGIHDLLLAHLKSELPADTLKDMHQNLLQKYSVKCGNDFSRLPDDNYIYTYICHHVDRAGQWDKYRHHFLQLSYVGAKLRATGPGDLLLDLCKYEKQLMGDNDKYKEEIADIVGFVGRHGWNIFKEESDFIQCGLMEDDGSNIYKQACKLAYQNSSSQLYFSCLSKFEKTCPLEMSCSDVSALCLLPTSQTSSKRVLISKKGGQGIQEIDMDYRKVRRLFRIDPTTVMNAISHSSYLDSFLSASEDGYCRVWNLSREESGAANTPPPSMRQEGWLSPFGNDSETNQCVLLRHDKSVTCAHFSSDGRRIVTASLDQKVKVWLWEESVSLQLDISVELSPYALSCSFTDDDSMVVFGCGDRNIYFYDSIIGGQPLYHGEVDRKFGKIFSIFPVKDQRIIIVLEHGVQLWKWDDRVLNGNKEELIGMRLKIVPLPDNGSVIKCAAYKDPYLAIGTSRGCLLMNIHLDEKADVVDSRFVECVDVSHDQLLLCTKEVVKLVQLSGGNFPIKKHVTCSHLGWNERGVSVHAMVTSDGDIWVYHDGKLIEKHILPGASSVSVSNYGMLLLVGTEEGKVRYYYTASGSGFSMDQPIQLHRKVAYLKAALIQDKAAYIAVTDPILESPGLIQVCEHNQRPSNCLNLLSPLVDTFMCCSGLWLLAVSDDGSIRVWQISKGGGDVSPLVIKKSGTATRITGASLSANEELLVLSDEKECFHVITLKWPTYAKEPPTPATYKRMERKLHLLCFEHYQGSNSSNLSSHYPSHDGDQVDGASPSLPIRNNPTADPEIVSLKSYKLPEPSWCCAVSDDGKLIAVGLDQQGVLVWRWSIKGLIKVASLPMGGTKVCHLRFSPLNIQLGSIDFILILLAASDRLSWWNMSCFVDNENDSNLEGVTLLLSSIKVIGTPPIQVTADTKFQKFAAVDNTGFLLLLKDWVKQV